MKKTGFAVSAIALSIGLGLAVGGCSDSSNDAHKAAPAKQEGMSGMSGMEGMEGKGMSGMSGMEGMEGKGMSGMSGMEGMEGKGMSGMSGMEGMEGKGMSGMSGMSGMEGKGMSGMSGMEGMSGMAGGEDMMALATKSACLACHKVDMKLVGPSYQDIAAKYKDDPAARDMLIAKVKTGGVGTWGQIPMPPNAAVSDENLGKLVDWILGM